jgi:preprotein translocase SecE subunit
VANKMADKKKNAHQGAARSRPRQGQMLVSSARKNGSEQDKPAKAIAPERKAQDKPAKAVAPEREERKAQESKPVRRETKSQSKGPADWQIRLRTNRYIRFILDAYYELRHKVTWPSFSEARTMTIVVILLSGAVGLVLWVVDLGLQYLYFLLTHIGH